LYLTYPIEMKMKLKPLLFAALSFLLLASCKKSLQDMVNERIEGHNTGKFVDYLITAGGHSSDKNTYKPVTTSEMKFVVKFDSSAIYQSVIPDNQLDINKLYGFSDNNQDHHQFSARIGWRWYNNQLELFGYVYNNGAFTAKYITSVPLNQEIGCSIQVQGNSYLLTANGITVSMVRAATTDQGMGYQLYPYFGGDEAAPHDIKIQVKNL
jgi:hypothetical protein